MIIILYTLLLKCLVFFFVMHSDDLSRFYYFIFQYLDVCQGFVYNMLKIQSSCYRGTLITKPYGCRGNNAEGDVRALKCHLVDAAVNSRDVRRSRTATLA